MATILKSKDLKIRKEQQCFSCLRTFPKDTLMYYQVSIIDGDFCTTYTCNVCKEIMSLSYEFEYEHGYVDGMLDKDTSPEELLQDLIKIKNEKKRPRIIAKGPRIFKSSAEQ